MCVTLSFFVQIHTAGEHVQKIARTPNRYSPFEKYKYRVYLFKYRFFHFTGFSVLCRLFVLAPVWSSRKGGIEV